MDTSGKEGYLQPRPSLADIARALSADIREEERAFAEAHGYDVGSFRSMDTIQARIYTTRIKYIEELSASLTALQESGCSPQEAINYIGIQLKAIEEVLDALSRYPIGIIGIDPQHLLLHQIDMHTLLEKYSKS